MTMPIGPDFIALQVRDLAASAQFYKDVFGFEAENQKSSWRGGAEDPADRAGRYASRSVLFQKPVRSV